jgi:hypothetical protein
VVLSHNGDTGARRRGNHIVALSHNGDTAVSHADKEDMISNFYSSLIGSNSPRDQDLDLQFLGLPTINLQDLDVPFMLDETCAAVKDTCQWTRPQRQMASRDASSRRPGPSSRMMSSAPFSTSTRCVLRACLTGSLKLVQPVKFRRDTG